MSRCIALTLIVCLGLLCPANLTAAPLYGIAGYNASSLVLIDETTGQSTLIAPLPVLADQVFRDLAYDPNTHTLYAAATGSGGNQLFAIDPDTGAASLIGELSAFVMGLAFDPNSNTLYGGQSTGELLVLDTTTAAVTTIGPSGTITLISMAFDPSSDTLYAYDIFLAVLMRLDVSTGAATYLSAFGGSGGNVGGIAFDSDSGTLFASHTATNELATFNTTTGFSTALVPFDVAEIHALAPSLIPEPGTAALLGFGVIALIRRSVS